MPLLGLAVLAAAALHDGPDPIAAWDFHPRNLAEGRLKARLGPDLVVSGTPREAATPLGPCLLLTGEQRFVAADDFTRYRDRLPKCNFTVEAWAAINMGHGDGSFIGIAQDNGPYEKGWWLGFNGRHLTFTVSSVGADDGDGMLTTITSKTEYEVGRFYHVAGTYDGRAMRLFVNGKLEAESTAQSGDILYPVKAPWTLAGYRDDNEDYPIEARMFRVQLYDRAATPQAIAHLFTHHQELAMQPPVIQDNPLFEWVVQPYLQYPTPTGITIQWETTRPGTSAVLYGPNKNSLKRVDATVTRNPQSIIHRAVLTGLQPESHYVYRTESTDDQGRKLESPLFTFRTAPAGERSIRFTVVGDTQDQPAINKRIAEHMWNERPDFFMIVGDLVGTGANKSHWTKDFFGSMRPLFDRVALLPVLGNHEGDARLYYDYMAVPDPKYCYRFTYGPAEIFVIDSNRNLAKGSEQYRWLEAALASSKARWKFVAHHHPPYSSDDDDYGNLWEGQSVWGDLRLRPVTELYEKYKVDIVWTGHIHSYERTWPLRSGQAAESGPIYIVCGGGGGGLERHGPTRPEFSNRIRHGHHYCVVSIHQGVLELAAFDIEGRLFDTLRLTKP
jgi:hypothetical protein